jgi:hypothetical protein
VETLVASFAADPPTGFDGDIAVDVSTTTVENNTPEGAVPASGQEVNVADNTDVDDYSFTLSVDTVPVPADDPFDVNEAPNINLTFVIDRSGSMWDDSPGVSGDPDSGVLVSDITLPDGIDSTFFDNPQHVVTRGGELHVTRFGLLKIALVELLNAYADTGAEVNVLLVQFASVADVISDGNADTGNWFNNDISATIDAIVGLVGAGAGENFTNYTDAVQTARTEFGVGTPSADQNLLYFLSDGAPTTGGNPGDNSIPDAELALWEGFLGDNLMKSLAVGIGEGIAAADDDLEDVAVPNDPFDNNPLIVVDESTLISTLVDTVPNVVDGNVLANDVFNADGQGDPAITQIVVDGVTYTFDGTDITNQTTSAVISGTVLAVLTAVGGQLEFDFSTGDFTYTAPEVSADQTETFAYTIQDGDGDLASADLVITVKDQTAPPVAVSDSVITNDSTVNVDDAWLVFNDSDPQGDTLGVGTVSGALGGTAIGGFADVSTSFGFASGFSIGSFNYQAHDFIQLSNTATVNLSLQAGGTLTGTDAGEILIGGSGADVLNGLGGQDVLVGNGGADQLDGGAGNDLLVGGPGADQVTGGPGSDVFQITADAPGTGVDNFTDVNVAEDVVDLSQLLGDYQSGDDISGFVQVSSTTGTISVDTDGGGDGFVAVATLAGGITAGEILNVVTDSDGTQVAVTAV